MPRSKKSHLKTANKKPFKGTKNQRQGQIYDYFRQQLYQQKNWDFLKDFTPSERTSLVSSLYKSQKLTRPEHQQILKQTNQAYREELAEQDSQLLYYKEKIGATNLRSKEFIKTEQFKYFWLEKGEHKKFWQKKQDFKQELNRWKLATKGKRIKNRSQLLKIYRLLYEKSPWRIRDRFLVATNQPTTRWSLREIKQKFIDHNPFTETKGHYRRALAQLLRRTQHRGEEAPESEIELDNYGRPKFKAGQTIALSPTKPGRSWTVYQKVPDWQAVIKEEIHEVAHESYFVEHGTALELQTWKLKKNKALCWVEAMGLGDCSANVGTSNWWCLECIYYGPYHPPVLPKHCPWEYTYRPQVCAGTQKHADANKQWHFSAEGEKRRDKIKGGDWGSCHIGTFGATRKKKTKGR